MLSGVIKRKTLNLSNDMQSRTKPCTPIRNDELEFNIFNMEAMLSKKRLRI